MNWAISQKHALRYSQSYFLALLWSSALGIVVLWDRLLVHQSHWESSEHRDVDVVKILRSDFLYSRWLNNQLLWIENISVGMLCGIRDFWIDVTPSPLGALFLFSHLFYKIQSLGTRGKRSLINIVLVISDMLENGQFRPKWPCRKWPKSTLELISVHQTIKGDPNNGLDELNQFDHS